jgi:hypothetical protein
MKGPDRPQTMQTTTPLLARRTEGAATTVAPSSAASDEHDSGKVDSSTTACEDWSVTAKPRAAIRSRYSAWRSAWFCRPNSLCCSRRFDARRLSMRAALRQRRPQ